MWKTEDFRSTKSDLIKILKNKLNVGKDLIDEVTSIGNAYGVPLTCFYEFVKEDFPEYKDICETKIRQLNDFYKE